MGQKQTQLTSQSSDGGGLTSIWTPKAPAFQSYPAQGWDTNIWDLTAGIEGVLLLQSRVRFNILLWQHSDIQRDMRDVLEVSLDV